MTVHEDYARGTADFVEPVCQHRRTDCVPRRGYHLETAPWSDPERAVDDEIEKLFSKSSRIEELLEYLTQIVNRRIAGTQLWINAILSALCEMPQSPFVDRSFNQLAELATKAV